MDFRQFKPGSHEYDASLVLRQRILREPLGLNIKSENLKEEETQLHFGFFEDVYILACVIAVPLENGQAKIRQMAVCEEMQGKGLGSKLLLSCLDSLLEKGFTEIVLNARKSALKFYQKHGFEICSEEFIEVKIPHYKMKKLI